LFEKKITDEFLKILFLGDSIDGIPGSPGLPGLKGLNFEILIHKI
jgi:hypothetical protein